MRRTQRIGCLLLTTYCLLLTTVGCGRKSSLLLQRQARGPLVEESTVARAVHWTLEPGNQTKTVGDVDVTVLHAGPQYLQQFFSNKQVFGEFAGLNPYFPEQLVFYVKVTNRSGKKIRIDPGDFVLLDDRGSQYALLGIDYTTALEEAKAPAATITRGVLEEARPGYFGVGLPIGKFMGAKPQRRYALLTMASLQGGVIHHGVTYDGLMAFWAPNHQAKQLKLLMTNIKTDFNANDWPQTSLEVAFDFTATVSR